jgi:PAS domain-containing protein
VVVEIARALRALDGAASHEAGIVEAFDQVAAALNADHSYLVRVCEGELEFALPESRSELLAASENGGWAARDDWSQACIAFGRDDVLMTDAALIAPELRRQSAFFQDFALSWRCGRVAAWSFAWGAQRWGFTLSRGEAAGSFDATECAGIAQIMASANRAAIAAGALADARRHGFAEGLARAGRAVILLDQDGKVVFVSAGAEQLLCAHFGVREGRLFATDEVAQAELDRMAARAQDNQAWPRAKPFSHSPPARGAPDLGQRQPLAAVGPGYSTRRALADSVDRCGSRRCTQDRCAARGL